MTKNCKKYIKSNLPRKKLLEFLDDDLVKIRSMGYTLTQIKNFIKISHNQEVSISALSRYFKGKK